jgi:hypothetical protein
VLTASPRFGRFMTRIGLCGIPEEWAAPRDLRGLAGPDRREGDAEGPAERSGQLAAVPSR